MYIEVIELNQKDNRLTVQKERLQQEEARKVMMLQGLVILYGEGGRKIVKIVRTQVFFTWGPQFLLEYFYSTADRDFQSSKWLVFNFIISPNINNLLYDFCTFRFMYFSWDGRFYLKYKKKEIFNHALKFLILSWLGLWTQ